MKDDDLEKNEAKIRQTLLTRVGESAQDVAVKIPEQAMSEVRPRRSMSENLSHKAQM